MRIARVPGLMLVAAHLAGSATGAPPTLPLSIPFDASANQVMLKVGIADHAPEWFIVDSGASACVIDTAVAARLGLKPEGDLKVSGAGQGGVNARLVSDVKLSLHG